MGFFFRALYQIANWEERVMMGVGLVCAFFSGVAIPMNAHMLGYVLNAIMLVGKNGTRFQDIHLVEEVDMLMYYELGVAAVSFLGGYGAVSLWSWSAARLGAKIRKCFLGSLMTQSVGWFEVNNIDELIVRFQIDIPKVDSGLGDRVPMCVQYLITWFTSYVVAFIGSWKLSLIIIFFTPVVIIVNRLVTKKIHNMALVDYQARASAGLSAEEALNRVSTVHAFETTDYECRRYEAQRQKYPLGEMQKAMVFGMGSAFPWVVNAMAFVVIFGYGDYLIREEGLDPGSVFPVFVGLLIALHAVQQFLFHLDIITAARNSLPPVLEVLECCSPINYFSDEGRVNKNGLSGEVAFRGVFFRFPKNIRNKVLNSLDIHITAKQSVALLSNHDYELSVIPKLIQRFYDINGGQVLLDHVDVREYQVRWLRHRISYISKESTIFPISVADNIRLGHDDVTQEDIEAAARDADLHNFVVRLKHGYETMVSEEVGQDLPDLSVMRSASQQSVEESTVQLQDNSSDYSEKGYRDKKVSTKSVSSRICRTSQGSAILSLQGSAILSPSPSSVIVRKWSIFQKPPPASKPVRRGTLQCAITDDESSVTTAANAVPPAARTRKSTVLWSNREQQSIYRQSRKKAMDVDVSDKSKLTTFSSQLWKSSDSDDCVTLTPTQRLQVVIARALVKQPNILLVDDVFALLKPASLRVFLNRLTTRKQTTMLLTSKPSHALLMERVVVIRNGRKVAEGAMDQLMTSHESRGMSNFVRIISHMCHVENIERKRKLAAIFHAWKRKCTKTTFDKFAMSVEKLYAVHCRDNEQHALVLASAMKQSLKQYEQDHTVVTKHFLYRVVRLMGKHAAIMVAGLMVSMLLGLAHTVLAFCVGNLLVTWYEQTQGIILPNRHHSYTATQLVLIILGSTAAVIGLRVLEHACYFVTSSHLTANIRTLMFEALLIQDIQFFGSPKHSPVQLAHSLTHDPAVLQGIVGSRTGAALQSVATLVAGFSCAVLSDWRTALALSVFGPLEMAGSAVQGAVLLRSEKRHTHFTNEASAVFMEAVENFPTLTSLNMQKLYMDRLDTINQEVRQRAVKDAHLHGLGHAAVSVLIFCCTALFLYTSRVAEDGHGTFDNVFMSFTYMLFSMSGVDLSMLRSSAVGYSRAKEAGSRIFSVIDSPAMRKRHKAGIIPRPFIGTMTFRLVSFHYPEEPDKQVLNNMSLEVRPGQTTALVGPSGCGKSTVFKLIERFYDVTFGALEVDGIALSDLNLGWWRDKVCVVQDNPELAGDSISEIITYGDTRNDISLEEVKEAATTAGIHQFIMTLPRGYYTCVEGRGRQAFTPEQRVRLAMARAVFRSPRFLLVDNVTSSLQPNTDEILRTLEQVKKDCTCIIATRYIAEITKADNIAVMSHGKVIEQGTHWELMALRGCYFVMLRKQEAENKSLVKKKEERKQKRIFFQRKLAESVIKQHGVGHLMSYSSRIASTSTTF